MGEAWKWTSANRLTTGGEGPSATTLQWGEGVEHTVVPWRGVLCEAGVIHCYDDPLVAVVLDPAHGRYTAGGGGGVLWQCEWSGRSVAQADKRGVETLRTLRVVEAPVVSVEQRVEIGIRAAVVVMPVVRRWAEAVGCSDVLASLATVETWAARWLDGTDRSEAAEEAEAWAAEAASAARAARAAAEAAAAVEKLDLLAFAKKAILLARRLHVSR